MSFHTHCLLAFTLLSSVATGLVQGQEAAVVRDNASKATVEKTPEQEFQDMKAEAEAGASLFAMLELSRMYKAGIGTPKDAAKAAEWKARGDKLYEERKARTGASKDDPNASPKIEHSRIKDAPREDGGERLPDDMKSLRKREKYLETAIKNALDKAEREKQYAFQSLRSKVTPEVIYRDEPIYREQYRGGDSVDRVTRVLVGYRQVIARDYRNANAQCDLDHREHLRQAARAGEQAKAQQVELAQVKEKIEALETGEISAPRDWAKDRKQSH